MSIKNIKEESLKFIDKILLIIIRHSHSFHIYIIDKYNSSKTKYHFLTPNDKAENIDEYSLALIEALREKQVKNIVISDKPARFGRYFAV